MKSRKRVIPVAQPAFLGNEKRYVQECLDTTWISSVGRFIALFETEFARFCGVDYAIACNTGTAALHLALLGLNVGPGDEIIVPTLTFVATANAVAYCGAKPVFVDSDLSTMNIDVERIEEAITPRTRGIIAVHLFGHPAGMGRIQEIATRHGLFVLEDAAEAHGALYNGRMAGGIGNAGAFSFFGNKIITTGEGGMVTTSDADLADRVRRLRSQGMDPKKRYWFPAIGYNYRMTNIEAAVGLAQLENIDIHLRERWRVAKTYHRLLKDREDLFVLPVEQAWTRHAYWMYTVVLKPSVSLSRDTVIEKLLVKGIETRPVFYPLHTLPPYADHGSSFPVAQMLAARGICLPTHELLSEDDVQYVTEHLQAICQAPRSAASSRRHLAVAPA